MTLSFMVLAPFFLFFNIYLFIWLHQVLAVARKLLVVACGV